MVALSCQIIWLTLIYSEHEIDSKKDVMMKTLSIKTNAQFELMDITPQVQEAINGFGVKEGTVHVFIPHTTAAVTINEGADPSVKKDILKELNKVIPLHDSYAHMEGNSAAHIKSSLVGTSEFIMIEKGSLVLGTWQAIFFCEFDGPRHRKVFINIMKNDI